MQVDETTKSDLNLFGSNDDDGVISLFSHTHTTQGKHVLYQLFAQPLQTIQAIEQRQTTIKEVMQHNAIMHCDITNGTLMVIEKFFETPLNTVRTNGNVLEYALYKLLNKEDYTIVLYSIKHIYHFISWWKEVQPLLQTCNSQRLTTIAQTVELILVKNNIQQLITHFTLAKPYEQLRLAMEIYKHEKHPIQQLITLFAELDAYAALAKACTTKQLCFPTFIESSSPELSLQHFYHPLVNDACAYSIHLHQQQNFLFLTGANMAGKSTFIKAIGICIYLAHLGIAVPAKNMQLCLFDGLLSNIHLSDNLQQGESYFYAEVKRVKHSIQKIMAGNKWLVLIDELFKGTNIDDAMRCSKTVIEGLARQKQAVFVLSTHLYELGTSLQLIPNMMFKYFETKVVNQKLHFEYTLKDGISNDKLGYMILEQEGIPNLLMQLKT